MQGPISWHGKNIEPVYNIGYTVAEGDNIDRALSEADLALKKGLDDKDAIVAFETAIDDRLKTEKTIGQLLLLSRNIKEGKLAAYHQLIVPLEREGIPWNESLLRIWDFASAYQPPGPYLPLLRSTGYDSDISDFMMSHASSFLERESCWLSINVNLKDLTRPPFIQRAAIVAERAAERGSRLILELLESDLMTSHENVIPIMEEFRLSKGMIAMDDFGSGYSNFGKLLSIPLDIVKFDGEFVRMAYANAIARSLLDRVSKSLKEAGIITVAEFIETEEQAEMLREMGIHYGQGYLWSKPAPAKT
jgi:EAL domain-containing protein (putative c-di-GMP-specific phosphodiesterase class I)